MRVLFQGRKNALDNWGGDTTQMVETKKALEKQGVEVVMSFDSAPPLAGFDICHIFNIQTAEFSVLQSRNAKKSGVPVALSTIYWELFHTLGSDDYLLYHMDARVRKVASISKSLAASLIKKHRQQMRSLMNEMVDSADILLPNSDAELRVLMEVFSNPQLIEVSHTVPNGVSLEPPAEKSAETERLLSELPDEYLLQVASFDPGKGQLLLLKEVKDLPIVYIGKGANPVYHDACRKAAEARGNVHFIDHVPHEQIAWFYERARVHALPSLRESPGLANLEAALYGANCVVSIHGPVTEYFEGDVWYCDPLDPPSIGRAVMEAWTASKNTRLKERIINQFTWDAAARETLKGYERVLNL